MVVKEVVEPLEWCDFIPKYALPLTWRPQPDSRAACAINIETGALYFMLIIFASASVLLTNTSTFAGRALRAVERRFLRVFRLDQCDHLALTS